MNGSNMMKTTKTNKKKHPEYCLLDALNFMELHKIVSEEYLKNVYSLCGSKLFLHIFCGKLLENRYLIIENNEEFKEEFKKIDYEYKGIRYVISQYGTVKALYPNGSKKILSNWLDANGYLSCKCGIKRFHIKKLVAKYHHQDFFEGCCVIVKDHNENNCNVLNLEILNKSENAKRAAASSDNGQKVGLFLDGKCVKQFKSIKVASEELYYNETAIRAVLRGEVKKPLYDLRRI